MRRSRFTEKQIIGVLKEAEGGAEVKQICRRHGIKPGHVLPIAEEVRRAGGERCPQAEAGWRTITSASSGSWPTRPSNLQVLKDLLGNKL